MAWVISHWQELLGVITAILSALVAVFMLIPGDQPEGFLQKVVDFVKKFSNKPKNDANPPGSP